MRNNDQDEEENSFFYHSPETGASVNLRQSPSEEDEDEKRRKRLNLSGDYIQLKFKEVEVDDPKDSSKKIKEYHIFDDQNIRYAKERNNGNGFLYDDIIFDGKGPLEIKIPCFFTEDTNGKKEFSKQCDVLYFDNTGKLIAFEKGKSGDTQLDRGWLEAKLKHLGVGLQEALEPGFSIPREQDQTRPTHRGREFDEESSDFDEELSQLEGDFRRRRYGKDSDFGGETRRPYRPYPRNNTWNDFAGYRSFPRQISYNHELESLRQEIENLKRLLEEAGVNRPNFPTNTRRSPGTSTSTVDSSSQTDGVDVGGTSTSTSTSDQGTGTILGSELDRENEIKEQLSMLGEEHYKDQIIADLRKKVELYEKHKSTIDRLEREEKANKEKEDFINTNIVRPFSELIVMLNEADNESKSGLEADKTLIKEIMDQRYSALKDIKRSEDKNDLEGNAKKIYDAIIGEKNTEEFDERKKLNELLMDSWEKRLDLVGINVSNPENAKKIRFIKKIESLTEEQKNTTKEAKKFTRAKVNKENPLEAFFLKQPNKSELSWKEAYQYFDDVKQGEKSYNDLKNSLPNQTILAYNAEEIESLSLGDPSLKDNQSRLSFVNHLNSIIDTLKLECMNDQESIAAKEEKLKEALLFMSSEWKNINFSQSEHESKIEELTKESKSQGLSKEKKELLSQQKAEIEKTKTEEKSALVTFKELVTLVGVKKLFKGLDNSYNIDSIKIQASEENKDINLYLDEEIEKKQFKSKYQFTKDKPPTEDTNSIQIYVDGENLKFFPNGEIITGDQIKKNIMKKINKLDKSEKISLTDKEFEFITNAYKKLEEKKLKGFINLDNEEIISNKNTKVDGDKYLFYILKKHTSGTPSMKSKILGIIEEILKQKDFKLEDFKNFDGQSLIGAMIKNLPDENLVEIFKEEFDENHIVDDRKNNILHAAIENNKTKLTKELINKGYELNNENTSKETVLSLVLKNETLKDKENIINSLMKRGAKVGTDQSILEIASDKKMEISFLEDLIKGGEILTDNTCKNIVTKYGKDRFTELAALELNKGEQKISLIDKLIQDKNYSVVKSLVLNGLDLNIDQVNNIRLIDQRAIENGVGHIDKLKEAVSSKVSWEDIINHKPTPTLTGFKVKEESFNHKPTPTGFKVKEESFNYKPTPTGFKTKEESFFERVLKKRNEELVILLIKKGAKISEDIIKDIDKEFLKAIINATDENDKTFLIKAVESKDKKLVKALIKNGVKISEGNDIIYGSLAEVIQDAEDKDNTLKIVEPLSADILKETIDKISKLQDFVSNNADLTTALLKKMIESENINQATKLIEAGADVTTLESENLKAFLEKIKENKDSIKVIDKIPTEKLKEFVSNNEGLTTALLEKMIESGSINQATKLIEAGADVEKVMTQVVIYLKSNREDKAAKFVELLHSKVVKKAAENKAKTRDDIHIQLDDIAKKIKDIYSSSNSTKESFATKEFFATPSNFKNRDKKRGYEI